MNENNISRKTQIGYSFGNGFIGSPFPTWLAIYFTFFLTTIAGMTTGHMATVTSLASTLDIFAVPIFGIIIQKFHFNAGKYRPWILIGAVIVCATRFLAMCTFNFTENQYFIWVLCTHLPGSFCFNLLYGAYMGQFNIIAPTAESRIKVASWQVMTSGIFAILFSLFGLSIINGVGRNNMTVGYQFMNGLMCFVTLAMSVIIFGMTKKVEQDDAGAKALDAANSKVEHDDTKSSIWDMIKNIFNVPMYLFLISSVCKTAGSMIISFTAAYYYTYVLGDMAGLTFYLTASNFLMFIGAWITPYIKKAVKSSKNTAAIGHALYAISLLAALLMGKSMVGVTICLSVGYMGWSIVHACDTANYSFIGDYVEWKTGKDVRAFLMSMLSFAIKIGAWVATLVSSWGLVAVGFEAENVTEAAIAGINKIVIVIPMFIFAAGAVAIFFYPLTEAKVSKMKEEIKQRKIAAAQ